MSAAEKRAVEVDPSARLDAERAIWVSFGSDTPMNKREVEARIRELAAKASETYGKTPGKPVLTKYVRSRKKRAPKVKR